MSSPVYPWAPVQMSAAASGASSIYQVGSGSQRITVNNFAAGRPLDLAGLRAWIDRLAQACAAATDSSADRAAKHSARSRTELIDDVRRDLSASGRQSKGKDCLRRLLVTGTVQYHASVSLAPRNPSEQMILDLLVFALWPVVQAPRLPKGWQGYLTELTSPLIAQVVIDAREAEAGRRSIDPPLLTRALAAFQLTGAASNLLEDLGDPTRGYGVVTAVAMAARLPAPAKPGARSLVTWLVAAAVGGASGAAIAEAGTSLIVDFLGGGGTSGPTPTGNDDTPDIGTSGGRGGRSGDVLRHVSGGADVGPDRADAVHDIIDHLFH